MCHVITCYKSGQDVVAKSNTQESRTVTMTTAVKWRQRAAVIIQGERAFVIYECDNETGYRIACSLGRKQQEAFYFINDIIWQVSEISFKISEWASERETNCSLIWRETDISKDENCKDLNYTCLQLSNHKNHFLFFFVALVNEVAVPLLNAFLTRGTVVGFSSTLLLNYLFPAKAAQYRKTSTMIEMISKGNAFEYKNMHYMQNMVIHLTDCLLIFLLKFRTERKCVCSHLGIIFI